MPDVSVFNIGGENINVKDSTSRTSIETLNTSVSNLDARVTTIEESSRLTVTYTAGTETISFTNA